MKRKKDRTCKENMNMRSSIVLTLFFAFLLSLRILKCHYHQRKKERKSVKA